MQYFFPSVISTVIATVTDELTSELMTAHLASKQLTPWLPNLNEVQECSNTLQQELLSNEVIIYS